MTKMRRLMTMGCVCAALAAGAAAVPVVSNVAMNQGNGSRLVTITYTLADADAVVTLDVQTNAADDVWVSIGGANIQKVAGDVWKRVSMGETRTITWRPDLSWPGHRIDGNGARAVVTAWSVDNPPDYMVVDLEDGGTAHSETYYPSVDFLPGGLFGNGDAYRLTKLVMRKIAAKGVTWTMGSAEAETGRENNDSETVHDATMDANYYIGVFPVTQAQWARIQKTTPSLFQTEGEMRPVERVSFYDIRTSGDAACNWPAAPHASSFLGKLRDKTGLDFDLPSEAQWEFACRAGHGSFLWGNGKRIVSGDSDANLDTLGRYLRNGGDINGASDDAAKVLDATTGTAKVGSYAPNDWGLYDMHGNVWEICLDWYEVGITSYKGAVNVKADAPTQTLSGTTATQHVRRGGCWADAASASRSARRLDLDQGYGDKYFGFRLVLPLAE